MVRRHGKLEPATWDEALEAVRQAAKKAKPAQKAVLVSPRLNNETIATLKKFERIGMFVAQNEAALCANGDRSPDSIAKLHDADAIIVLGAQPSQAQGVVAAKIRTTVRQRGAKLLIFHTRKSDLDQYATICANVVSLERKFWDHVADVLREARRPVLVYGPEAMTPIGVAVLERLVKIFEAKTAGPAPALIALPTSTNSLTLAAGGIEPVEEIGPWLDAKPLKFLHIVASDEPDGGERLLDERYVWALLEEIDCVVVQAAYQSRLTDLARVVLPATIWCEKQGTITNFEGRELPLQGGIAAARRSARGPGYSGVGFEMKVHMSDKPKVKVATVWLGGCSGCHMSFLDLDERLVELVKLVDITASPITDVKEIPSVDVGIVEGAVCNEENEHVLRTLRARCKVLIALGDCAITGNIPALRNQFKLEGRRGARLCRDREHADRRHPRRPRRAHAAETGASHPGVRESGRPHPRLPARCRHHLVCADRTARGPHAAMDGEEFVL